MINNIIPPDLNANKVKKFYSSRMASIFSNNIHAQSKYSSGDIVNTIRNAIANKMYIETYVRNYNTIHTPSGDTLFKRLYEARLSFA
ncbi:hypothetical protein [Ferroplasma acidiphilum]|uniref:hypothetical protein n=1 Tax=Ferroplasma acidiphilum TaxID=74969 RepID=UPI001F39B201|nr:hypothetical protein [Ferroplasma acidiphilum]